MEGTVKNPEKNQNNSSNPGTLVSVRGSVVDTLFEKHLPPVYTLLHTGKENQIAIEVLTQLDAHYVRGIALTPTEGLARGMAVEDTGGSLKVPVLEERISNTDAGAIMSIQAVYVPADDFTDPAAVHTFSHLSASIVLSRKRASDGLYPAVDPLQSNSKMSTPGVIGERHYHLAQEIRQTLAQYADLKDIISMLGLEQLSQEDRNVVARARCLECFLMQPFFTTEQFTGFKGKYVSLSNALEGCERILRMNSKTFRKVISI